MQNITPASAVSVGVPGSVAVTVVAVVMGAFNGRYPEYYTSDNSLFATSIGS